MILARYFKKVSLYKFTLSYKSPSLSLLKATLNSKGSELKIKETSKDEGNIQEQGNLQIKLQALPRANMVALGGKIEKEYHFNMDSFSLP